MTRRRSRRLPPRSRGFPRWPAAHTTGERSSGVTELILRGGDAISPGYPIGAVSMSSRGEQMSELAAQKEAGCVAFTDDGRPVASALLMRRALEYAGMLGVPIVDHCEDPSLKGDGVAHEGFYAARLGLRGIPGVAESIMVERESPSRNDRGSTMLSHDARQSSRRWLGQGARRDHVICEGRRTISCDRRIARNPIRYTHIKMNRAAEAAVGRHVEGCGRHRRGQRDRHAPHHADEKLAVRIARPRHRGSRPASAGSIDWSTQGGSASARIELLSTTRGVRVPGVAGDGAVSASRSCAVRARTIRAAAMKSNRDNGRGWISVRCRRDDRRGRIFTEMMFSRESTGDLRQQALRQLKGSMC